MGSIWSLFIPSSGDLLQNGEYQLTDLDYPDDIAIFDPSACVLQDALTILFDFLDGIRFHDLP